MNDLCGEFDPFWSMAWCEVWVLIISYSCGTTIFWHIVIADG
jgi:hypothetical protein